MSVKVSQRPTYFPITAKAKYTADTSLTESSSYQNLRIRASLLIDGEVAGIIENPKGLTNFDFRPMLDSLCGRLVKSFKQSATYFTPVSSTANIVTGWSNVQGTTNFSSGSAGDFYFEATSSTIAWIRSAAITGIVKGDIIAIPISAQSTAGEEGSDPPYPVWRLTKSTTVDTDVVDESNCLAQTGFNGFVYLVATENITNAYIWCGGIQGNLYSNYTSEFYGRAFKVSPGKTVNLNYPCVYYKVKFQTYYEDSSDVTQYPSTELNISEGVQLYVPMQNIGDNNFMQYVCVPGDTSKKAPCLSLGKDDTTKHFIYHPSYTRLRVLVLIKGWSTTKIYYSKNNGAYSDYTLSHAGWLILNLEPESFLSGVTSSFRFYMYDDSLQASQVHELEFSSKCFDSPVILDFKGRLGYETIVLNGYKKETVKADRETFKDVFNLPNVLNADFFKRIEAETNYQLREYHELLAELLYSSKLVFMYDSSWVGAYVDGVQMAYALPVYIETDNVEINEPNSPTNNKIAISYYPYHED
jgi:hypothetical protein